MSVPRAGVDPSQFPDFVLDAGFPIIRIHLSAKDPLHFSGTDLGRFDPPVSARQEYGTCYFSESSLGAYLEVFGRTVPIRESWVHERVLTEVHTLVPLKVADLTHPMMAGRVGAIPELSVGPSYVEAQALSSVLREDGFDGIRYMARHDPTGLSRSVAIFSDASSAIEVVKTVPIPGHVIAAAESEFGLFVLPDVPLY